MTYQCRFPLSSVSAFLFSSMSSAGVSSRPPCTPYRKMVLIIIEKTVSAIQIETATSTTAINTTTVFIASSCLVGQVTFSNSAFDSFMNPVTFPTVLVSLVEAVSGTVIISTSVLKKHLVIILFLYELCVFCRICNIF